PGSPPGVETALARLGRQPGATAAAELLVGLVRSATRRAGRGERGPTFPAESALGAVLVVAGRAAHRGVSRARGLPRRAQTSEQSARGVVSRPESRDSATASAFGTWPWRDTSGPDPRSSTRAGARSPIHNYCQYLLSASRGLLCSRCAGTG